MTDFKERLTPPGAGVLMAGRFGLSRGRGRKEEGDPGARLAPPRDEIDEEHDDGDDQNEVNQASADVSDEAE
jgi:hypothetical protein